MGLRVELDEQSRQMLEKLSPASAEKGITEGIRAIAPGLKRKLVELSPDRKGGLYTNSGQLSNTGFFAKSWQAIPSPDSLEINNSAEYAKWVEDDTRAHKISPKDKKALSWRANGKGPVSAFNAKRTLSSGKPGALDYSNNITVKSVNHPGTKGQHVFARAYNALIGFMNSTLAQAISRAFLGH